MKTFEPVSLSLATLERELDAFADLLASSDALSERDDLLPFFRAHRQLAALVGASYARVRRADGLAFEYPLFGDYRVDLAVGDRRSGAFCLVEFEDARRGSVFRRGARTLASWSPRLLAGFGQIVDWLRLLDDMAVTERATERFGVRRPSFFAMLVVGRSRHLTDAEQRRLAWFSERVVVNSQRVRVLTFDNLLEELRARYALLADAA